MAHYQISIEQRPEGGYVAALFEENDFGNIIGDGISEGLGNTPREAVGNIDWHHDWTRYQIEKERNNG